MFIAVSHVQLYLKTFAATNGQFKLARENPNSQQFGLIKFVRSNWGFPIAIFDYKVATPCLVKPSGKIPKNGLA